MSLEKTDQKIFNNSEKILYRYQGINTAVDLLRPGAVWEVTNDKFTVWDDPRPCPTMKEVEETIEKIKKFEESINTIWRDDQIENHTKQINQFVKAFNRSRG